MQRYAAPKLLAAIAALSACVGPRSHDCSDPDSGESWVCPQELSCANPPTYCANPLDVGACDGKPDGAPCQTAAVPDGLCVDDACQACSPDIAGCRYIGWNQMTAPSDTYTAVWTDGSADGWAGGSALYYYDGAHWQADPTFPALSGGGAIKSISGTGSAHLFVGTNATTVYHRVGGAWASTTPVDPVGVVWAAGDEEAFAAGALDIDYFDGSAWTQVAAAARPLAAIAGSSPTDVYAVGTAGTVMHYDGTAWTGSAGSAGSGNLVAIWDGGAGAVYAGGAGGIFHFDGSAWQLEYTGDAVSVLWGSGPTDLFAGTADGILHSDGGGLWVPLVAPAMVVAIAGSGPDNVLAASGTQISRYTGAAWSTVAQPADPLVSVSVVSPATAFAAGGAALDRFDGTAWTTDTPSAGADWDSVWARAADDAYAVTGTNIAHWSGSAWSLAPSPDALTAVAGTSTATYAVGLNLYSGSGGIWTMVAGPFGPENALWVAPDDGSIFVAGDKLYVVHGSTIDPPFDDGTSWYALWGTSSSDVFAAGANGAVRHYDGTAWSDPMATNTTVDLHGLWGTGDDDVFAAGANATLLHYHAQLWSVVPPPANVTADFASVSGSASTILVVGTSTACRLIESAP